MKPKAPAIIITIVLFIFFNTYTQAKSVALKAQKFYIPEAKSSEPLHMTQTDTSNPVFIFIQFFKNEESQGSQKPFQSNSQANKFIITTQQNIQKSMVLGKIQNPIKLRITSKSRQIQCIFDESTDLCTIQKPQTQYNINIECLVQEKSKSKQCIGQMYVKQAKPFVIPYEQVTTEGKIKYNDGFFQLPQTESHSLMLLFCEDQKQQSSLAKQIKIYSNIKFHRRQDLQAQQSNQMVGYATSKGIKDRYVYLEIKSEAMRKCLQFQYHVSNSVTNGQFMLDFVNMTDNKSMAQNIYTYYATPDISSKGSHLFNYNMHIQINIFNPNHLKQEDNYNMEINVLEVDPSIPQNSKQKANDFKSLRQISSFKFNSIITKQELHRDTHFYAKYSHYHFSYILGHQFLKNAKIVKIQILIYSILPHSLQKKEQNFLFMGLNVQDTQNIVVQQLTPSFLTIKKGQSLSFTIEEPFQVNQIQAQGTGNKVSDLITIIPSSKNLVSTITEHSTEHDHIAECHFSQGCKFQLRADQEDCIGCVVTYGAQFIKGKNDVLLLQVKNDKISGKIELDQYLYFYYKLGPAQLVQAIINNPNVILYTLQDAKKKQCKLPSKTCNSDVATYKQSIVIQNKATIGQKLVFLAVKGLDNSHFTIRFQKFQNQIKLANGQIFSYRLSSIQDQMRFIFQTPGYLQGNSYEHSISFNLISPLNSLQMLTALLNQKNQEIEGSQKHSTMSGYIRLQPSQVKSKKFLIKIKKQLHFSGESVHFSIIASTSNQKIKLDAGVTHYQSLSQKQSKKFIIQYVMSQEYSLGFHTFNVVGQQVHVDLSIQQAQQQSKNSPDGKQKNVITYAINKAADKLYLNNDFATVHHLCQGSVDTCQLIITLKNHMPHLIDISLILMGKQSLIELKDGVWQSFKMDQLIKMSHFYFIPTHQNNPAKILFKSTNPDLSLQAVLFQTGEYINPSQWPYPQTHGLSSGAKQSQDSLNSKGKYSSRYQIVIDDSDPAYKNCFPNCVILISLRDDGSYIDQFNEGESEQTISILASNFLIQLPQKTKITLQLKQKQENLIFIDLRKVFDKKFLTFFTFFGVGFAQVYGNVYWPAVENIPTAQQHQISFDPYQTQLSVQTLKQYFKEVAWQIRLNGDEQQQTLLQTEQVYLCLLIVADQPTKMTLQFTSDKQQIKQVHLGSTESINFKPAQQSILYFVPTKDYRIKFIRNSGYPFFHILTCDHTDNQKCLDFGLNVLRQGGIKEKQNLNKQRNQMQQEENGGKKSDSKHEGPFSMMNIDQKKGNHQMIQKTQTKYGKQCSKCIIYIWTYSIEDAELTIQLNPLNNQIQLQQNRLTTQYLNQNQVNKFSISAIRTQWTVITIHILQGSPIVKVSDNLEFQQTQTKKSNNQNNGIENNFKMIVFKVPPIQIHQTKQQQEKQGHQLNSLFNSLHVSIESQDKQPVSYTISYSSGQHIVYLDDGVISSHLLNRNEPSSFYYKNKNKKSHVYLTMTVQASNERIQTILESMLIKIYYIQTLEGEGQKKYKGQIQPQRPQSLKASQRTTLTFQLPNYQLVQIQVTCKEYVKLTVGINHRQIIFLPLDYSFPVQLHAKQQIQIIIQNFYENAYLQFIIKKCDQSNPLIYYTNDQAQFIQDSFSNYDRFGQENVFKHVSKTKDKGKLYLKLVAAQTDSTLIVQGKYINMDFSKDIINLSAGNFGILQYQLINSQMAQISLSGLQCQKGCVDATQYYLVVGDSLAGIYRDIVCQGHSFQQLLQIKEDNSIKGPMKKPLQKSIQIHKLIQKPGRTDNKMVVPYKLIGPISFVTIKAVHRLSGQQVYYKHLQITTLSGHLNRLPMAQIYFVVIVLVLGIGALIILTKIWARRGYQPLNSSE